MKNLSKMFLLCALFSLCLIGVSSYASTGTDYTGTLTTYLQTQKEAINSGFDAVYSGVYAAFAKTGLTIIKSIEYQGLVCLGAIQDQGILAQLQKERTSFKVSFNKDFVELEKRIAGLEEKKRIQEENSITMFDPGTTYESEKAKLKDEIDTKSKTYKALITGFATTYTTKTAELIKNFQSYLAANTQLLQGIKTNMTRVQTVLSGFDTIETNIAAINKKIIGLDTLMQKMEAEESKIIAGLDTSLQSFIGINIKKYKRLQNLSGELTTQKTFILGQYQLDIDEYFTKIFQNRYDHGQYMTLKKQVEEFQEKFYTSSRQLNCSSILSTTDESANLLAKIAIMQSQVNSGLAKIEKNGVTSTFKDQIYSGFQNTYAQKFKQRYAEYQSYLKNYIKTSLQAIVVPSVQTPTVVESTPTEVITTVIFTRPFTNGQYHQDIKALQNVLTTLGLYSGAIDGIYTSATKNAVYQFQLSKGLLKGYEKKPSVRGYFGPATRNAINNLTK